MRFGCSHPKPVPATIPGTPDNLESWGFEGRCSRTLSALFREVFKVCIALRAPGKPSRPPIDRMNLRIRVKTNHSSYIGGVQEGGGEKHSPRVLH